MRVWCSVAKTNKCKCAIARAIWCRIHRNRCTATWQAWNVWTTITNHYRWWLHRGRPAKKASFATVCRRARKSTSPLSTTHAISKPTQSHTISHISFHSIRVHSIYGHPRPISMVKIGLSALPSERYKRNVIRGKLDLVGEHFINCIPIDPRTNNME